MTSLLLACLIGGPKTDQETDIASRLVPLSTVIPGGDYKDLGVIGAAIGESRVVAMGEATHGTREFFQMKHRVFRYLAEKKGFKIFALEASMPDCIAMDRFVTKGEGDPKAALANQGFWTWNTQEVLDLLLWMREFNKGKDAKEQLRVYGFDMQSKSGAIDYFSKLDSPDEETWWIEMDESRFTAEQKAEVRGRAESLLNKVSPADQPMARMILQCLLQADENEWIAEFNQVRAEVIPMLKEFYIGAKSLLRDVKEMMPHSREWLTFVADHEEKSFDLKDRKEFLKKAGKGEAAIREDATKFSDKAALWKEQLSFIKFLQMAADSPENVRLLDHREKSMAQNIADGLKTVFPGQKAFVWAHNGHISTGEIMQQFRLMGAYCRDLLKEDYFPIGFAFNQGSFRASGGQKLETFTVKPAPRDFLESNLAGRKLSMAWLSTDGLKAKTKSRSIGALFYPDKEQLYVQEFVPADYYKGMILIDKTTAAKGL